MFAKFLNLIWQNILNVSKVIRLLYDHLPNTQDRFTNYCAAVTVYLLLLTVSNRILNYY